MRHKFKTGAVFALLVVAGALTASAVAGLGPLRATQTTTTLSVSTTTTTATTTTTGTTTTTTPRKLTICHHTRGKKGTNHRTITISRNAWNAHQRHGDSVGACTTASAKKFHSRKAHIKKWHKKRR